MLKKDATGIARAVALWRDGGLVAFPTETVYGLGADARDAQAVAAIFEAKGRPAFNPLIVHVSSAGDAGRYVEIDHVSKRLAEAFWPGPLTLVLPLRADAGVSPLVTAGMQTLAIRVPGPAFVRDLLAAFDGPIAAPSANPSGRISPTTAAHVVNELGPAVDAVIDGGACDVGVESTIVAVQDGVLHLLREGGVPREDLERFGPVLQGVADDAAPVSPGQLASHYAPRGAVRLGAVSSEPSEVMVGFGPVKGELNLSDTGDLAEAAARLFDVLHRLDAMGAARIAVAPVPDEGLGRAINDRLRRAAAPR